MVNYKSLIQLFLVIVLLSSCSPKIPFTQSIRDKYNLTELELKGIQFYLSDAVLLRRGTTEKSEKSTEDGTLVINSGKEVEQITFKSSTPCAINKVLGISLVSVAFEDGPEKHLVFGSGNSRDGYYRLQALSWDKGRGKINYGGSTYYSAPGSENAILLFRMKSLKNLKYKETVVKGKSVK
jgi:hypothetical protein